MVIVVSMNFKRFFLVFLFQFILLLVCLFGDGEIPTTAQAFAFQSGHTQFPRLQHAATTRTLAGALFQSSPTIRKNEPSSTEHHPESIADQHPLIVSTQKWQQSLASGVAASMIAMAAITTQGLSVPPAHAATAAAAPIIAPEAAETKRAVVELSRGTIVVQTSDSIKSSSSILDSKRFLKTLFANRKELSASIGRIQSSIAQEVSSQPVWKELSKEILSVEGDVAGMIQVLPPADWKETIKDVSAGKLNVLVNGELVNVQLLPTFGEQEDDLIISIKGFKGNKDVFRFASDAPRYYGPIRTYFSKYDGLWNWWALPYPSQVCNSLYGLSDTTHDYLTHPSRLPFHSSNSKLNFTLVC
jgi:hypothetical protein